jgi:hypothetical protein
VTSFGELQFVTLPEDESTALQALAALFQENPSEPTFLVLGSVTTEAMRRRLRLVSQDHPLFFLETNDAPNHLSLAREAKLVDRVIRFLSPGIFSSRLSSFPIQFVAGNAEYLSLFETLHFQLKGTPSASEVEMLTYLLRPETMAEGIHAIPDLLPVGSPLESPGWHPSAEVSLARLASRAEHRLATALLPRLALLGSASERVGSRLATVMADATARSPLRTPDRFTGHSPLMLLHQLAAEPSPRPSPGNWRELPARVCQTSLRV